jgi:hypothetical protein
MQHHTAGACADTLVVQGYIRIDNTWDWSIFLHKATLLLALLAGLLWGREDLEIILRQLLN